MSPAPSLTWPDYVVLLASLAVLLAIGIAFTGRQRDTVDFVLARRSVPWWAACLSFLATEISAVTIISVPATAYAENWIYVQFFIGSSLAKLAVAFLFIPAFYRHQVTTIYEFLRDRFGRATQVTGSLFFFLTRLTGSGARLTATAIAVSLLVGWRIETTIIVTVVVSIAYIATGGVSAIVWTNVFQALMFLVAGAVTLGVVVSQVDGGIAAVMHLAQAAGRLRIVDWGPAPGAPDFWTSLFATPNIVWVAVLNGFVGSMAAFGTDHDLMQRLLTVETRRESQRTLALTPLATLLTLAIYLSLGAALYAFYTQHGAPAIGRNDEILPYFVAHSMPPVLGGLMLAAIVLASIDSPLGSLAASFVTDISRPLIARDRPEAHDLRVSRVCVVVFGLVLGLLAWAFLGWRQQILWLVFKIAGVPFGSLLGVFLLGLLTRRRVADAANVVAMVVMTLVNMALLYLSETGRIVFPWSWLVIVGTAGTMLIALGLSPLLDRARGR